LKTKLIELLKQYYGYDTFRSGQYELIEQIINGQDALGIMPTGGGKSLCYQIPALYFEDLTLIISPLISLMKDQVDTLNEMGIPSAYINSSLSQQEIEQILNQAKQGELKLLYVAPERLESEYFQSILRELKVAFLAVDEAHCVSQWGHDFRPAYLKLSNFIQSFQNRPIVATFTATATEEVKQDIIALLKLKNPFVLTKGFNRENLYFEVEKPQNKQKALFDAVQKRVDEAGIIYCSTRKNVDMVAEALNKKGYQASKYHAGLSDLERTKNQDDFLYDRSQIMVATNAFGMGIDKSNIRYVIHYNMPMSMEAYYQEAGRAGRDGLQSDCILLFNLSDVMTNKFLIQQGSESQQGIAYQKLNVMLDYCNTDKCLRSFILSYFGEQAISNCDDCSNCLNPIETTDITEEAQKIMSAIKRMNERFGAGMVTDVLRGANTKKIRDFQFDSLSTYGIMKNYQTDSIREMISFLISENFLKTEGNQYPILMLGPKAVGVLTGKESVFIKRQIHKQDASNKQESFDFRLFESLRQLRKDLAEKQNVPPFVLFSDLSLQDMARKYPRNEAEFLGVTGVGQYKSEKYGQQFLERINDYCDEHPELLANKEINQPIAHINKREAAKSTKNSHLESYELFKQGNSVAEIMKIRNLAQTTVEGHLVDCISNGMELDFDLLINKEYENQILEVIKEVGTDKLKPIKDLLPDAVSYGDIKFVIAKHAHSL
jgi:ATP-dependent DNA helicase RecQ